MNGLNKENKYPNLTQWCEHYHKESGLKVHPSSVPVDVVLDDLMGQVMSMMRHIVMITTTLEKMTERFQDIEIELREVKEDLDSSKHRTAALEKDLLDCNVKLLELQNPIEEVKPKKKVK